MAEKTLKLRKGQLAFTDEHLTTQAYKDDCDINSVMARAAKGASLSHLANHGGSYGDFSEWDANTYNDMRNTLARAETIFNDLPAELRDEFSNDPGAWLAFVNNPDNKDRLEEIYPTLAQPGKQLPDVISGAIKAGFETVAAASTNDAPVVETATENSTEPVE